MSNPGVQLIIKMVVSGIFVGLISEIAKRIPGIGGLLAALPIISLTTIFWLRVGGGNNGQVSTFIVGVMIGLIPTSVCLLLIKFLIDHGMRLAPSVGIGLIALTIVWVVARMFVAA